MKKYLFLVLFLSGCSRNPVLGNCVLYDRAIFKVHKIGSLSVELIDEYGRTIIMRNYYFKSYTDYVDCFDVFKGVK